MSDSTTVRPFASLLQTSAPSAPVDAIAQAPFFRDPVFQEFYRTFQAQAELLEDLRRVFDRNRYAIKDADQLALVHEDAFLLYDIMEGKRHLSELLAVFEKGVAPGIFAGMLVDLHRFLAPRLPELVRALPPSTETPQ